MPRIKDNATAEGRQRHLAKYQRILDAALEIFAERGFHAAKISEIARLAGVADGTIYLYFKNKDDLLLSLLESKLAAMNDGLRAELAAIAEPRERLGHIIAYHLRQASDNPTLARFMTLEMRRSSHSLPEAARGKLADYLGQWTAVIEAGKAAGAIRPDVRTDVLQGMLYGALDQACVTWVSRSERQASELDVVASHLRTMLFSAVSAGP